MGRFCVSLRSMHKPVPISMLVLLLTIACRVVSAESPSPKPESRLEGVISIGPIHGGPTREGVPDSKPLAHTEFVVMKEKVSVASFQTDEKGRFRISLPPGHYTISRKDWNGHIGSYGPFEVDITAGEKKTVQWECDSGIR